MKGKRGPVPESRKKTKDKVEEKPNGKPIPRMKCDACVFETPDLTEMTEHLSGSGHTGYGNVKEPELFSEPKPISRRLRVKLDDAELNALNSKAGKIAMMLVEQREIATLAKERAKALEADQTELVATLRDPHKLASVNCEWRIDMTENKKSLVRLDTNETIETAALSAEDRAAEEKRAAAINAVPPPQSEQAAGATA